MLSCIVWINIYLHFEDNILNRSLYNDDFNQSQESSLLKTLWEKCWKRAFCNFPATLFSTKCKCMYPLFYRAWLVYLQCEKDWNESNQAYKVPLLQIGYVTNMAK